MLRLALRDCRGIKGRGRIKPYMDRKEKVIKGIGGLYFPSKLLCVCVVGGGGEHLLNDPFESSVQATIYSSGYYL